MYCKHFVHWQTENYSATQTLPNPIDLSVTATGHCNH